MLVTLVTVIPELVSTPGELAVRVNRKAQVPFLPESKPTVVLMFQTLWLLRPLSCSLTSRTVAYALPEPDVPAEDRGRRIVNLKPCGMGQGRRGSVPSSDLCFVC